MAAVAATTGVHLGVIVRDRLRRDSDAQRAARTASAGDRAEHRRTHDDRRDRRRAATGRRSRAPRARPSTPLRTTDAGPDRRVDARGAEAQARHVPRLRAHEHDGERGEQHERDDPGHRAPPHDERDRDHAARRAGSTGADQRREPLADERAICSLHRGA